MSKDDKGNTVSVSSSNNISMYVFNGVEEDCTYEKYEKRIKCGLEYKELEYVLGDDFELPTDAELKKDQSDAMATMKDLISTLRAL